MPYTTPYLPVALSASFSQQPKPATTTQQLLPSHHPVHTTNKAASSSSSSRRSSSITTTASTSIIAGSQQPSRPRPERAVCAVSSRTANSPHQSDHQSPPAVGPATTSSYNTTPAPSQSPLLHSQTRGHAAPPASSASEKRPTERRRSTLTSRFPLLRKASREVAHTQSSAVPSIHIRGTSSASHRLPSDPPPPTEPRASTSSSRAPIARPSLDTLVPSHTPSSTPSTPSVPSTDEGDSRSRQNSIIAQETPSSSRSSTPNPSRGTIIPSAPVRSRDKKMHQTSSRLLRMTDDERPFTRDFKDLFSTLMVSLPLTPHRVRFRMIDFTFTSDEAITNLGSLKFSQSNRMPDPKDSSRVVTTTTTTTFSMAKEMARSVCQKFLEAKFIESVENKVDFQNKGSVWQLTPKGIHILERFCSRNGIVSSHVKAVIESNRNPRQLVILERNTETDKLHHDEQTVQIIFRRFVGPNVNETASSDADSIHEFAKCDVGVRMVKHKPTTSQPYKHYFSGKATVDWLMDCCTMVDRREGLEIGSLFLQLKLIAHVDPRNDRNGFSPMKGVYYYVTPHGEKVAGWSVADDSLLSSEPAAARVRDGATRDSNSNRTLVIIRNPSWRLLYREFLKETMCEENLSFYLEVQEFKRQYKAAMESTGDHKIETIRETLAAAYGLYNAFLAPGSPNELNIDHALRTQLATRMTRAVGDDNAMEKSLEEVAALFDKAQNSIFKLMSSDSVPKFIKHPKYSPQLRNLDAIAAQAAYAPAPGSSRS